MSTKKTLKVKLKAVMQLKTELMIAPLQTITFDDMLERIEKSERKWRKEKGNDAIANLPYKIKELLVSFRGQQDYPKLKQYVENKVIIDTNVKKSTSQVVATFLSLVALVVSFTALVSKTGLSMRGSVVAVAVMVTVASIIVRIALHPYLRGYPREKSFYQIMAKYM